MASIIRVDEIQTANGTPVVSFNSSGEANFSRFKLPIWTDGTRPASPEVGLIGFNTESKVTEIYDGTEWISVGSSGGNPADTNAGGGWSIDQGADGSVIATFTTNSMVQYKQNNSNQGAGNAANALNFTSGCGPSFAYHDGHQVPAWWPMYHAIQVTTQEKGKVLNTCKWHTHSNAIGNVDFFGTNQSISSSNFTNESLWTHLGRAHFGGAGGGSSDCTVYTRSFNPNNYGYQWYMLKGVDNQSSPVAYPGVGSRGGWAMYTMGLGKS
jgi:hypothetical protein